MAKITPAIERLFQGQGCVVVSTIDKNGYAHSACKGVVKISPRGKIYLFDLYLSTTYENLKRNPRITLTAIDEHKFTGYCLKGRATMLPRAKLPADVVRLWDDKITSRLTQRLLKNLREEKGQASHPEALLPKPEYMIAVAVEEVINLTPRHLQQERTGDGQ